MFDWSFRVIVDRARRSVLATVRTERRPGCSLGSLPAGVAACMRTGPSSPTASREFSTRKKASRKKRGEYVCLTLQVLEVARLINETYSRYYVKTFSVARSLYNVSLTLRDSAWLGKFIKVSDIGIGVACIDNITVLNYFSVYNHLSKVSVVRKQQTSYISPRLKTV